MVEEALEVATEPDYRFDLAIQLGKLDIAKVEGSNFNACGLGFHLLLNLVLQKNHMLFRNVACDLAGYCSGSSK